MMGLSLPLTIGSVLASVATRDEESFLTELRYLPQGWLGVGGFVLFVAICWAVVWMYRREGRIGASYRIRMGLAVLRCLILLILSVILLEPVRVRILRKWIDSYTIVLVDNSSSMDLEDHYRDEETHERVKKFLDRNELGTIKRSDMVDPLLSKDNRDFLRKLAKNNRVKLFTFSSEPQLQSTIRADWENATSSTDENADQTVTPASVDDIAIQFGATGSVTNIERAVRRTVESLSSSPIAAVVVLSDGGFNQGASAQDTARYALEHRLPIHVVGVGDPASPRNIRVTEIQAPENAFAEDPFSLTARLTSEGMAGESIRVQLRERDATRSGEGQLIQSKNVSIRQDGEVQEIKFQRSQNRVGRYIYEIVVPPLESESVIQDNSRQITVNIIDARTRVLMIAGSPSWEYRFVSRLLERDETFEVSCWLQSADLSAVRDGNTVIDHLPLLADELFEYDVIILMDPDPSELDQEWCRLVDTWVTEYGGGLLYTAARSHTPVMMRERKLKPLHDLLPVTLDPEVDILLNQIGHYQLSSADVEIPSTAIGHPVIQLADDNVSTRLAWQGLGDVYWHYPVMREKPAATVLMRHAHPRMRNANGGHILSAVQFIGAGRTGFLGFDSTWRWRKHGIELFDRFWVQQIRFLAEGRLLGGTKRGMLQTQSDEYSLGEVVNVTARLFNSRYEPLRVDEVRADFVIEGERQAFSMTARRDQPGWYEGRFVPDRIGHYNIRILPPRTSDNDPMEIVKEIRVTRPNIEIIRPQMDRAELVTLAEQSFGGEYYEIDEATQLTEKIPDLHAEIPIRSRPTTLWDNSVMLTVLVLLLSLEWGVRKWNRLL